MDEKKELCNKSSDNKIENPPEYSVQTEMSDNSVLKPTPEMKKRLEKRIEEYEKQRELQEQLYAQLSEEDREALKLGKELQRQRKQEETQRKIGASSKESRRKKNRRTKSGGWKKNIVSVAAGIGIVIAVTSGLTISSVGGPKQALKIAREMFGERTRITVNGITEGEEKKSGMDGMDAEEQAYQQIKDELGFDPVRLGYLPEGMVFDGIAIDKDSQEVYMRYYKEKEDLTFIMQKRYTAGKTAIDIEDQMISQQYISMEKGEILLTEYQIKDINSKTISAEFEYDQTWYCIYGQIEKAEMKKIVNNLNFF